MRKFSLLIFSVICMATSFAQQFNFNNNCLQAYRAIFKLRMEEGKSWLAKEKKEHPANYLPYFIENYIDFLQLNINDNSALYEEAEKRVEARISQLKKGDSKSPYYLYTQADVHLQWALCKIKFGDNLSAVFEVKKAYSMLEENQQKFPDFKPNMKSLGLLHTLFGAVPDKYKFGAKLLGLKGSIEQGLKELTTVMKDEQFVFREETVILYTLLVLHLKKDEQTAWQLVEQTRLPLGDNLLNHFVVATVANHTGKNDQAIAVLTKRPVGAAYYPFPVLDFLLGNALLNKLDDDAVAYLKKFIAANKGRSYVKEAYRKLAWYYLIKGQPDLYKKYMKQVLAVKYGPTDEDKSAQKEALMDFIPHRELLKARVLSDGAYWEEALQTLQSVKPEQLTRQRDQIEYYYRKARIYHESGQETEAVKYYLLAIQKGEQTTYYFAANACLKVASIFEKQNKKSSAAQYYKKAMVLPKDEYANSIDAEAKAGLNRLGI